MDNKNVGTAPTPPPAPAQTPPAPSTGTGKSNKKLLYIALVVLGALLIGGAVWYSQQSKIDKLEKQVSDLEAQADDDIEGIISDDAGDAEEVSAGARDIERQTDIKAIHAQVEAFYAQNGYYPLLKDMNDAAWRAQNMRGLDTEALQDPLGSDPVLVDKPKQNFYSYEVTGCDETQCARYTLTASLEDGKNYVKQSLN